MRSSGRTSPDDAASEVELHATALGNLVRGDPLWDTGGVVPLALAAAVLATVAVFAFPGVVAPLLALLVLLALWLAATLLVWSVELMAVPVAAPARLARGEFFGEMALLTGEARSASVSAAGDLAVLVIRKHALQATMVRRPGLAQEMAEIVEARRQGLRAVQQQQAARPEQAGPQRSARELVARMRQFFGL